MNKNKIALLVIYNHRYDKNIPLIEKLYQGRFSHIFHVVPFYDGNIKNTITVYESSYYFEGYIAQAYQQIKNMGFTHYYVIADDLIINPIINENNFWKVLGLSEKDCFYPYFLVLQQHKDYWLHAVDALQWEINYSGVEASNLIPTYEEAQQRFSRYNLPVGELTNDILLGNHFIHFKDLKQSIITYRHLFHKKPSYPLVGGYSDTFLVTADVMPIFSQYCGIFAATRLFVELAIPTALVLSANQIKTEKELNLRGKPIWDKEELDRIEEKYEMNIQNLINNFPKGFMYLHPIKLSKWTKII